MASVMLGRGTPMPFFHGGASAANDVKTATVASRKEVARDHGKERGYEGQKESCSHEAGLALALAWGRHSGMCGCHDASRLRYCDIIRVGPSGVRKAVGRVTSIKQACNKLHGIKLRERGWKHAL